MTFGGRVLVLLAAFGAVACRVAPKDLSQPVASNALQLDPLIDIVPGAGLAWMVQAKPGELLADKAFARALDTLAPPARFEQFAARYGGIDLRQAREVVVAGYPGATLAAAALSVDAPRVEAAFANRALTVEGRAVEHDVIRLWGSVDGEREQIAIFGREAVAIEHGRLGPLRPAVYFAEGRLRRARPALRADPLAAVAARLGDAPLRGFAPGPFDGVWGAGLGGLLGATTAVAGVARFTREPGGVGLSVRLVLAGRWGRDAAAAADRFAAIFQELAQDPLGHLTGIDRPLESARVVAEPDALELDVTLDPFALARGLRAATGASLHEILGLLGAD